MLKVVHITPSYKPAYVYGGPTISVSQLCEILAIKEHSITVLTTTANGKSELAVDSSNFTKIDGVKVRYFKRWTKDHSHFSPSLLYFLFLNCKKFDIIHIHSWWNFVSIPAVFICLLRGINPVLSPRGMLSSYSFVQRKSLLKRGFQAMIGNFMLEHCIIHFTTYRECETSKEQGKNKKIFIEPNIVKLPATVNFNDKKGLKNSINFVFVSRINPVKNLEMLLDALSNVTFNWNFNIYGVGENDYIDSLKRKTILLKINDKINWLGWIGGDLKYEIISNADILVLTSFTENFANIVIESLAVGTPVLLSKQVGLSNYVLTEKLGWITDLNTNSMLETLEDIYRNRFDIKNIGLKAIDVVRRDFEPLSIAEAYCSVYKKYSTS